MPLFRFHRGCLEESLKTTVIVKNREELKKIIYDNWWPWSDNDQVKNYPDFSIKIETSYNVSLDKCFDPRCGWYQHYVSVDIMEKGKFNITGFLSEPLEE